MHGVFHYINFINCYKFKIRIALNIIITNIITIIKI